MPQTFIELAGFTRLWRQSRLTDDDLRMLQLQLLERPDAGVVMSGTGGMRKIRFAPASRRTGKSGAFRVCYVYFHAAETVILLTLFAKSDKENLTPVEKAQYKAIIAALRPGD
jgi:hypothetical protein